jgi:2-polyprenyl-3-methyl-5-hydroxy-6-metoxy-1,4-benzoquinol methylase
VSKPDYSRFEALTFERFRELAKDGSLSAYEKIGFPNAYREGHEENIFADMCAKLTNLALDARTVLDIGCGVSSLPRQLTDLCIRRKHRLLLVDAPEVLNHLPDHPQVEKTAARYPDGCPELLQRFEHGIDVLLCYSVLHYIFLEASVFDFLDRSLALLAPGGQMLIGDIPNVSKRKRFFSSPAGIRFHQQFTGTNDVPEVVFNAVETGKIDDAVVLALVQRARAAGFDAYIVPQAQHLPLANRREDVLIIRP